MLFLDMIGAAERAIYIENPVLALDRIMARPATLLGAERVDRAEPCASDHLPLVADLLL